MTYDDWRARQPDEWPSVEDDDCPRCGAGPHDPCDLSCDCAFCLKTAQRRQLLQLDVVPELVD